MMILSKGIPDAVLGLSFACLAEGPLTGLRAGMSKTQEKARKGAAKSPAEAGLNHGVKELRMLFTCL